MSGTRTTLIIAAALAGALVLPGCAPKVVTPPASTTASQTTPSQATTGQASVEPTTPAGVIAKGPITTPLAGSAERTALLDAARTTLHVTNQFYVYQLYVQGDTALGDIEPTVKSANGRLVVAWERRNGTWTAIGASKFGSTAANAAQTARALPSFSSELISKIDWTLAAHKPGTTTSTSSSSMLKSLSAAAQKWSKTAMSGKGTPYKLTVLKVAQDAKGVWWGHVVSQPSKDSNGSYEALEFWAKYSGGAWQGKVQDPEPPAPSTYFPSSVIAKLGF